MKFWKKVVLGLILGVFFGYYCPSYTNVVKPVGDIFLRMIKMIISPLVFFSLVSGVTGVEDSKSLSRLGIKATLAFLGTTLFAVIFGISIALLMKPGVGVLVDFGQTKIIHKDPFDLTTFLTNLIPNNIIRTFLDDDVKQVVFLAIFTGITLNKISNSRVKLIKESFNEISKLILKMITIVIELSPYAAFSLIAWVVSKQGIGIIISLSKLVISVTIAMIAQYIIFGLLILIFSRISPIPFYKKSLEYQILAFSTSSSKATLPVTMQVCREKLGISESSTSFVLPLGASINMNGFAINLGLCTIFFAQVLGVNLNIHEYLVIILTSTLGSIGGAGIPGASLIMLPMVLASVNLPIEGVAILAGVDRILDMLRTTINITGDVTTTLIIDHSEGTLDKQKYFS